MLGSVRNVQSILQVNQGLLPGNVDHLCWRSKNTKPLHTLGHSPWKKTGCAWKNWSCNPDLWEHGHSQWEGLCIQLKNSPPGNLTPVGGAETWVPFLWEEHSTNTPHSWPSGEPQLHGWPSQVANYHRMSTGKTRECSDLLLLEIYGWGGSKPPRTDMRVSLWTPSLGQKEEGIQLTLAISQGLVHLSTFVREVEVGN